MAFEVAPAVGPLPDRLSILRPGIYRDENERTWKIIVVKLSPSQRARLRGPLDNTQETIITVFLWRLMNHSRQLLSPSLLPFSRLPLMWQLYPGRRYQATDSRLWEVEQHNQASVALQMGSVEQLILTQQPAESG